MVRARSADLTTTIRPRLLPDNVEIVNPLRGFYTWQRQDLAPLAERSLDAYQRFSWASLERGAGQYDFSGIEEQLSRLPKGGKLGFRVFALNSCCSWNNGTDIPADLVSRLRKGFFLPGDPNSFKKLKQIYIPDWNDPYFLQRVDQLLDALGRKYDGDPRIGWVDIGIYGNWGEWHTNGLGNFTGGWIPYFNPMLNRNGAEAGTLETRRHIIDSYARAFKKTRLLMMTDDKEALVYALRLPTPVPIGMRRDSWGSLHFANDFIDSKIFSSDRDLIVNRWKTAPFIVESFAGSKAFQAGPRGLVEQVERFHIAAIGNGNFAGRWDQVPGPFKEALLEAARRSGYRFAVNAVNFPDGLAAGHDVPIDFTWLNQGVTPAYEPWHVEISLVTPDTARTVATARSAVNLEKLLPAQSGVHARDSISVPANLPPGRYEVRVHVTSPASYRPDLRLANEGRNADGSYTLGSISFSR
jgi:hypothetical protein